MLSWVSSEAPSWTTVDHASEFLSALTWTLSSALLQFNAGWSASVISDPSNQHAGHLYDNGLA